MTVISDQQATRNIGSNVRRLLDERGVSMQAFADGIGEPLMTVWRMCNAKCECKAGILARTAQFFGIAIDDLIFEKISAK